MLGAAKDSSESGFKLLRQAFSPFNVIKIFDIAKVSQVKRYVMVILRY